MTADDIRSPVIKVTYKDETLFEDKAVSLNSFRKTDLLYDSYDDILSFSDNTKNIKLNAIFGIIRTVFVCIVLSLSSIYFSKDTTDLVVRPIEVMLEKVKKISNNPLEAAQIEEQEVFLKDQMQNDEAAQNQKNTKKNKNKNKNKQEENTYETSILERTIIKIGGLLALGFGESGSNIIASNMAVGGEVNPMLPGKKTMAIFGFCDIRNFIDVTEIL